jgi:hypothetical protein
MITDKLIVLALLILAWDYPFDRTNIVFEVWRAETSNMAGACLEATTTTLNYQIDTTAPQGFFRVRARDMSTGEVSDWATTAK